MQNMPCRRRIYGIMLTVICVINVVANLAATKIAKFPILDIPVDAGIYVFPLGYVITDLFQDKFGLKEADYATFVSMLISVATAIIFIIIVAIPPYPDWVGQTAFESVFKMALRVTFASVVAYMSRFLNNRIFADMRHHRSTFFSSSVVSTLVSQVIDTLLFEIIAFVGILPFVDFVKQAVFALLAAMILDVVATMVASFIKKHF